MDPNKSKIKGIIFSKNPVRQVSPVILNGDPLPWVSSVKHLGNTLQCNNTMQMDCALKRGKFIGKLNALSQEFHYVRPDIYVRILNLFTTSFYGSSLWNHNSRDCEKFFTSWNVAIRHCFGVSRKTHRYLIEEISQSYHPQVMMSSRLVSFHSSLISSNKFPVRFLARLKENDQRSVLGQNLAIIRKICGGKIPSKNLVKRTMKYFPIPEEQKWRVSIIRELLDCREGSRKVLNFTSTEIGDMLEFLCTS